MNIRPVKILIMCGLLAASIAMLCCCGKVADKYVPEPEVVNTAPFVVGAFRCPLWYEPSMPGCWDRIKPYPERTPVLGYYNEALPELVDWEIKYALEHGISFFFECWFRAKDNLGQTPVKAVLDHWLEQGFFKSRYADKMKFAILWENTNGIASSISSADDMIENLVPYWIKNYFSKPNYLRVDGKPVFMIYGYNKLLADLGGVEQVADALKRMKTACNDAGLGGVYILAEHHEACNVDLSVIKSLGFDAVTSYHWPTFSGKGEVPTEQQKIVDMQAACWEELQNATGLPTIPTISMGWDSAPWGNSYSKSQWHLDPEHFEILCRQAKKYDLSQPVSEISSMVLLDNWNEFGEGHYIAPSNLYGFGYVDAVRNAFSDAPTEHKDIKPEEIGLGPYTYCKTKNNL